MFARINKLNKLIIVFYRYDCASSEAILYSSKMPQESILWAYYSEYGGGWDVADCPNYYCEYAEHCGAKFLNSSEGSLRDDWGGVYMNDTEFEAHAKDADVWIYAGFDFDTYYSQKKEILDGFESIKNKRVFDYSSNAWFEQRFAEPGMFQVLLQLYFCSCIQFFIFIIFIQ